MNMRVSTRKCRIDHVPLGIDLVVRHSAQPFNDYACPAISIVNHPLPVPVTKNHLGWRNAESIPEKVAKRVGCVSCYLRSKVCGCVVDRSLRLKNDALLQERFDNAITIGALAPHSFSITQAAPKRAERYAGSRIGASVLDIVEQWSLNLGQLLGRDPLTGSVEVDPPSR